MVRIRLLIYALEMMTFDAARATTAPLTLALELVCKLPYAISKEAFQTLETIALVQPIYNAALKVEVVESREVLTDFNYSDKC